MSVQSILRSVASPEAGGTVAFIGSVRARTEKMKVTRMELEAAEDLARADLERIVRQATRKFKVTSVGVAHRVGSLGVGDIIVVIAVSAPHRADAFSACRFIIDELKKTTPIWKKEFGRGRQRWVEGVA